MVIVQFDTVTIRKHSIKEWAAGKNPGYTDIY